MNLEQARNKTFDDILYVGLDYIKNLPALPPEHAKTDEWFFQSVFEIYNAVETMNPIIFYQKRGTGMTTALQYIISYYTLHHKEITIVTNPGSYHKTLEGVYIMFANFLGMKLDGNFMSNKILLKENGHDFCEISILSVTQFDNANLKGPIILDSKTELKNSSKFNDLFKTIRSNVKKYDKFALNFPENENISKLAKEYNIDTKKIKIF